MYLLSLNWSVFCFTTIVYFFDLQRLFFVFVGCIPLRAVHRFGLLPTPKSIASLFVSLSSTGADAGEGHRLEGRERRAVRTQVVAQEPQPPIVARVAQEEGPQQKPQPESQQVRHFIRGQPKNGLFFFFFSLETRPLRLKVLETRSERCVPFESIQMKTF